MVEMGGVHGADHRDVICLLGQVRHHVGQLDTGLAVPLELEGRGHEAARFVDELDGAGQIPSRRLARVTLQGGLGIEQVHLAGSAVHEELNDGCRLGVEMRLARLEVVDPVTDSVQVGFGARKITAQQPRQGGAVQPVADPGEEGSPRQPCARQVRGPVSQSGQSVHIQAPQSM